MTARLRRRQYPYPFRHDDAVPVRVGLVHPSYECTGCGVRMATEEAVRAHIDRARRAEADGT